MSETTRRQALEKLAALTGSAVLMPLVTACGGGAPKPEMAKAAGEPPAAAGSQPAAMAKAAGEQAAEKATDMATAVPTMAPEGWDPIAYNKTRGNAGAIPETYWPSINGPDGDKKHLGKHLPYVPEAPAEMVPEGFVAVMWGDPGKGYAKHPNAAKSEAKPKGHWYNWIKIRKAGEGEAEELKSTYADWPGKGEGSTGAYAVLGGGEMTADGGRNTIYLAALPKDVKKGDTVRIWAHCLTHGEYVDFLKV